MRNCPACGARIDAVGPRATCPTCCTIFRQCKHTFMWFVERGPCVYLNRGVKASSYINRVVKASSSKLCRDRDRVDRNPFYVAARYLHTTTGHVEPHLVSEYAITYKLRTQSVKSPEKIVNLKLEALLDSDYDRFLSIDREAGFLYLRELPQNALRGLWITRNGPRGWVAFQRKTLKKWRKYAKTQKMSDSEKIYNFLVVYNALGCTLNDL